MTLLLDTHILLWAAISALPPGAERYISDLDNTLYFSPASIWEVAIKRGLERADFKIEPDALYRGLTDNGYEELPISSKHTLAIRHLPNIHKDPFDRLLIAQAAVENIALLTADSVVAKYPGSIIFVS
jgi:PIN domain nuclease of toxin-antitoxin system